jgi:hypothetical protein
VKKLLLIHIIIFHLFISCSEFNNNEGNNENPIISFKNDSLRIDIINSIHNINADEVLSIYMNEPFVNERKKD